eukprot:TRINITY_DN1350_c3_g1_i1.p1 TRINITY_DN1350_c3_g1~~TRINITY_DN1350_c3_g1_i1.p1  ORF type:complete len:717 (+),score=185.48 TRINITY_DN1350_c3_g1_i1:47-2197(+)
MMSPAAADTAARRGTARALPSSPQTSRAMPPPKPALPSRVPACEVPQPPARTAHVGSPHQARQLPASPRQLPAHPGSPPCELQQQQQQQQQQRGLPQPVLSRTQQAMAMRAHSGTESPSPTSSRRLPPPPPEGRGRVASDSQQTASPKGERGAVGSGATGSRTTGSEKEEKTKEGGNGNGDKQQKIEEHRNRVVNEILSSEKTYVEQLECCVDVFLTPLRGRPDVVAPDAVETIFSNIEAVLQVNHQLMADLEERLKDWGPTHLLGDLFLKLIPFLRIYSVYTSNYDKSNVLYTDLREHNSAFLAFITDRSASEPRCKLWPLNSFLILPVQRIPRYKMLLEDLCKHTQPDHPDIKNLQESLAIIQKVAHEVNEQIKAQENRRKMMEIQQRVGTIPGIQQLVVAHRTFVREGTLWKVCRKSNKKRFVVLFNDLLIYGSMLQPAGFRYHRTINLDTMQVMDQPDSEHLKNAFSIGSAQKSFIIYAETQQEKVDWLLDLVQCVNQVHSRRKSFAVYTLPQGNFLEEAGYQAPLWQTDHQVVACNLCGNEFSLLNRRHHCRACGLVVCKICSQQKMSVPSFADPQRVCDACFAKSRPQQDQQEAGSTPADTPESQPSPSPTASPTSPASPGSPGSPASPTSPTTAAQAPIAVAATVGTALESPPMAPAPHPSQPAPRPTQSPSPSLPPRALSSPHLPPTLPPRCGRAVSAASMNAGHVRN